MRRSGFRSKGRTFCSGAFAGALALAAWSAPVQAQVIGPSDSFTDTFFQTLTFNPVTTTTTLVNAFSTQVLGRLNGGVLFSQTFAAAANDPSVQTGFNAARLAITTSGGPGVIVGAPQLISSNTTSATTSSSVYSLAGTTQTANTVVTFGPASVIFGVRSTCNVAALPSTTQPTCVNFPGTVYNIGDDETNFNTHQTLNYTIDTATTNTTTTTLSEVWAIDGVVQALGRIHALTPSAVADQGERFSRRLLDAAVDDGGGPSIPSAPSGVMSYAPGAGVPGLTAYAPLQGAVARPGYSLWLNGFGWVGQRRGANGVPGDRRNAVGVEGGFAGDVTDNLRLGLGVDHSQIRVALRGGGESARIDLTQAGLFAGWRDGPWYIAGAATAGFADVATSVAAPGFAAATGSYDARAFGISGEAGYRFLVEGWRVAPHVGAAWRRVRLSRFTETGALALTSPGGDFDRGKIWAGLAVKRLFDANGLTLSAYARVAGYSNDNEALPVAFAGLPGAAMSVAAAPAGRVGAEAGLSATLNVAANAELYASYDARLRSRLVMHTGTAGLRVRW